MSWQGKVCVVTGASSGIGRATAVDLAGRGARLCVAARREDRLARLVEDMGGGGAGHSFFVTDVSKRKQAGALAAHVAATYGRCDLLINNAGFARERAFEGAGSLADIELVMQVNFYGALYCTAELFELLKASAPADVVNVASIAGRLASGGTSGYCASKFALVGWSEAARIDLAAAGIKLHLVEPGPIPTEGFPQRAFAASSLLSRALVSEAEAATAIRRCVERGAPERTVPRWWYLLRLGRLFAPPLYRAGQALASRRAPLRRPL